MSVWCVRHCSTGPTPGTPAGRSCSVSRTPTRRAIRRTVTPRSSTRCGGSDSTGTRVPKSVGRTVRTGSPNAAIFTATWWRDWWRLARPIRLIQRPKRWRHVISPPAGIRRWGTTITTVTSPRRSVPTTSPRAARRCCACGCPMRTSAGVTWCAVRRRSAPEPCRTSHSLVPTGIRCTPWSTRWTMR